MAAIQILSVEQTTEQTHTTDTNWTAVTGASLSGFTVGDQYLILVNALAGGSVTNNRFGFRVVHGSTEFPSSYKFQEPSQADKHNYFWWTVWSAVSGESVAMEFMTNVSANTVSVDEIRIIAINLDADLTENTDWHFTSDASGPTAHTTTYADRAALTFTPGSAGDDWLILSRTEIIINTVLRDWNVQLLEDGANTVRAWQVEGEHSDENLIQGFVHVAEGLSAASHTFKVQTRDDTSGTQNDYDTSAVFALNLNKFESHVVTFNSGTYNHTTANTYEELATTGNYAPTTTGDHVVFGDTHFDGGAGADAATRLQFDGTSNPTAWENYLRQFPNYDATDQGNLPLVVVQSVSSAGDTIDLDGRTWSTSFTWADRTIVAFSAELATAAALVIPRRQLTTVRM